VFVQHVGYDVEFVVRGVADKGDRLGFGTVNSRVTGRRPVFLTAPYVPAR